MPIGFELSGATEKKITYTNHQNDVQYIVIAHITGWHVQGDKELVITTTSKDHRIKFNAQPPLDAALTLLEAQF